MLLTLHLEYTCAVYTVDWDIFAGKIFRVLNFCIIYIVLITNMHNIFNFHRENFRH